ncbi:MAG: IS66 family transposase [Bacteriovoracia bacterium]
MTQEELFAEVSVEKFDLLSREELIAFAKGEQKLRLQFQREVKRLSALNEELKQKTFLVEEKYIHIKNKFYGRRSEKAPRKRRAKGNKESKRKVQLPSERYPDAPIIERHVELANPPKCRCCSSPMRDSGLTEDSQFLTVIPAQYLVILQRRHKYSCSKCYGDIQTAPAPPSITPGSSYSDEMKVDVALSKYCDLIPIERYASIAGRAGLEDLPHNSLIEATHQLADFVKPAYEKSKIEVKAARVLHADETPHRMLEGSDKSAWHLWGFSSDKASFFEIHDTRSADVTSDILVESKCEYLMSDIYSGYGCAVRKANKKREELGLGLPPIKNIYCNAHARRKFKEAAATEEDRNFFIVLYKRIYFLEKKAQQSREKQPDKILWYRSRMTPLFRAMKDKALALVAGYSSKSLMGKALAYFLENYEAFTLFLGAAELPIDNNQQERLLRNPVVGRKTWYGTHSERGAKTAAILFTLVESCKLLGINPREYFKALVRDLHQGKAPYTPAEFKLQ